MGRHDGRHRAFRRGLTEAPPNFRFELTRIGRIKAASDGGVPDHHVV
jgi:hypothetical protein